MFLTSSAWFLLLLLLVPLILIKWFRARRVNAIDFSSTGTAAELPRSWRQRLRWLPRLLGLLTIVLLIVSLARPQEGKKKTITDSEGIAIELVVDRSGSMQAMDFKVDGKPVDRLTAIKDVAGKFVLGGKDLKGRFSDLIGLITFARYADAQNPPTLDHSYLMGQLNRSEIVKEQSEDGTAIGDAIGLAIEKLNELEPARKHQDGQEEKIKSKIMILLTDGENNAGELDPLAAAELAKSLGIKIYTIGVGTKGQAPFPVVHPFTGERVLRMMEVNIDEETLTKVAEATGGKYFRATDTQSLERIYREIDQLEKSHVEARHFVDYRELAVEPVHLLGVTVPPLVLLALITLAGQVIVRDLFFREVF